VFLYFYIVKVINKFRILHAYQTHDLRLFLTFCESSIPSIDINSTSKVFSCDKVQFHHSERGQPGSKDQKSYVLPHMWTLDLGQIQQRG
jgi:hypothetical protein